MINFVCLCHVFLQGYMWKLKRNQHKMSLIPQWNRRWFSIERHLLKWYASPQAEKASGVVDLRFVTDIASFESSGGVYSFVLSYPDRNLLLRAQTLGEMEKWMRALQYQADIVRGGDGTGIVTDTNSFCLSPQGKGRAIKGKYRPSTLEANVEAAMNRLQVLESEVSKQAGGVPIRAKSMLEREGSRGSRDSLLRHVDHIRPEDVNLSEVGNSQRSSILDKSNNNRSKRAENVSDALLARESNGNVSSSSQGGMENSLKLLRNSNDPTDSRGYDHGVGNDEEMDNDEFNQEVQRKIAELRRRRKQDSTHNRGEEKTAMTSEQPGQSGFMSRVRDRKHSIDDDLQSIEEINDLPIPRVRMRGSNNQIQGHRSGMAKEYVASSSSSRGSRHNECVEEGTGNDSFNCNPPNYDNDDIYKDGTKGSFSGKVSAQQAKMLKAAATARTASMSRNFSVDGRDDDEFNVTAEDVQEMDLNVRNTSSRIRGSSQRGNDEKNSIRSNGADRMSRDSKDSTPRGGWFA